MIGLGCLLSLLALRRELIATCPIVPCWASFYQGQSPASPTPEWPEFGMPLIVVRLIVCGSLDQPANSHCTPYGSAIAGR